MWRVENEWARATNFLDLAFQSEKRIEDESAFPKKVSRLIGQLHLKMKMLWPTPRIHNLLIPTPPLNLTGKQTVQTLHYLQMDSLYKVSSCLGIK